jgi:hypothetical protein
MKTCRNKIPRLGSKPRGSPFLKVRVQAGKKAALATPYHFGSFGNLPFLGPAIAKA